MKVLHLCLASFYPDGYSYQENLLPKFHKKLGYDVEVVASLWSFDKNGNYTYLSNDNARTYNNEYDIKVTRLKYKHDNAICKKIRKYIGTYEAIENAKPDIIFMHGCQFLDIKCVVKYAKKHPEVKIFVDNHADFSNSATNFISKNILHKFLWKNCAQSILPYVKKFYGVLPARVDFLHNVYKIPRDKIELLVMGADDDLVNRYGTEEVKNAVRKEYTIDKDDFLILFGGKVDLFKQQVLLLMDAVNELDNDKLKLIVFGSVVPEMKEEIEKRCSSRVQYIGWKKPEESFPLFAAADLAVFPGRHSVFWEQVAGQGIPMLVKYWDGTTHVDFDGNVEFLYDDSVEEIKNKIAQTMKPEVYNKMKSIAVEKGMKEFSYLDIAKRSIEKE